MKKHIKLTAIIAAAAVMCTSILSGCLFDIDELYVEDTTDYASYDTSSTYTLMVYLCGSDLESDWGCATEDLLEMIEGYNGNDSVNIIVQTGGSYFWHNFSVEADRCQRFRVTKTSVELIDDTVGDKAMSSSDTLSDFIKYASSSYPADRYGLVLWNHGGGSAGGFGYDEKFDEDMMSMTSFGKALSTAGLTFDFIGFDACLMGGFETCLAVAPYTNYLIASQESEPGCGWYYTDFIAKLSSAPSTSIIDLGKIIIDTYIEKAYEYDPSTYSTLGMFDTQKVVSQLLPAVNELSLSYKKTLSDGDYKTLSKSRAGYREMTGEGDYVDLYSIAETDNNTKLKNALAESTVYFAATKNGTGDNGLSIYYPYYDLDQLDSVDDIYDVVDYDVDFDDFIDLFANIMALGQIFLDSDIEDDSFLDFDWFDSSDTFYDDSYFEDYEIDYSELAVTESGDDYILELSDDDWDKISSITLCCIAMYDDIFINFGQDDYYELDKNDNLIVGYDQRWVALNGSIVPFFFEENYETDDYFLTSGYVPCIYNDKDAEIVVAWDTNHPDGYVAGVRMTYDNDMIASKGLTKIKDGDIFSPYYDVYDKDMNYVNTITLDDEKLTVKGDITVSYEDVTEQLGDTYIYYEIRDLFNNSSYTESIVYAE
ncbi:MAG: hypothetical protein IIZ59_00180 [Clostridia bacterium]|nr:hypothetical protein [Clostridia bacterium]